MECIFCKIINGEIPSQKVFENEYILAFRDIAPMAPVHVVIVPKKHIESVNAIDDSNVKYITEIFMRIPEIAASEKIYESGYRVVTNCGDDGCQSVKHLHFHLLGGKHLQDNLG